MEVLENQYVITAVCFLFIPLIVYVAIWFPEHVWIALLLAAIPSMLARFVENKAMKTLIYVSLGFASFWIAGETLYVPLGEEWRLLSFTPFLILACANAVAALVAYNDGEVNGTIFAGGSLVAILLTRGPLDAGSIDRFLLTGLLFTAAVVIVVRSTAWARGTWYAIYNAFKAGIYSGVVYGVIYVLRVFDVNVLNISDVGATIGMISPLFLNVLWSSALATSFVVSIALLFYELILYLMDLQRIISDEGVTFVKVGKEEAEKADPFAELVNKLETFFEKFSSYDVDKAAQLLLAMEKEYYRLSAKGVRSPMKANAGRMLIEARSMLLGTQLELPISYVSPMVERKEKRPAEKEFVELPKGSAILVEGPIGSRKEVFCLDLVKRSLNAGEKAMVISFEPEKEGSYLGENENLRLVRVEQNINDMALSISRALEEKPKIVFFNVLYWLAPNYSTTTLSGFLASTIGKLKKSDSIGIFVIEQAMLSPQALSTIESVFDGVIEFAMVEESGKIRPKYRIKELKFQKFDSGWHEYW